jgi:hypothetical protein
MQLQQEEFEATSKFIEASFGLLSGTHRQSGLRNILQNSESEADRLLEERPHDQWPASINPVELRRYFIAAIQRRRMISYFERQLDEVRMEMRNMRSQLVERYQLRDKAK